MVDFNMNITTEAWDERLFNCKVNQKGKRALDNISQHWLVDEYERRRADDMPEEELWSIDEGLDKYDLETAGTGKTRVVVYAPEEWMVEGGPEDCIIKIQWDGLYHQNSTELNIWQNANGRQAAILNPILDHDPRLANWLVMPRADTYQNIPISKVATIANRLRGQAAKLSMGSKDIRAGNVGRVEGRDVVIDYGQMSL